MFPVLPSVGLKFIYISQVLGLLEYLVMTDLNRAISTINGVTFASILMGFGSKPFSRTIFYCKKYSIRVLQLEQTYCTCKYLFHAKLFALR